LSLGFAWNRISHCYVRGFSHFVRVGAIPGLCVLRLILRHKCAASCAAVDRRTATRFREVVIGHLEVVPSGDVLAVSQPRTNHVRWELLGQFGLARTSKVVENARPRLQSRSLDDLQEGRSPVMVGTSFD